MNKDTAEFVIFIINAIAEQGNLTTAQVYHALEQSGCIQNYLVPCYDVLHTMGAEAIAEDVTQYVRNRGGSL